MTESSDVPEPKLKVKRAPARWVVPTLVFFAALFVAMALDEILTGEAGAGGVKGVPRYIAHAATEPGQYYFVVGWNFFFGMILLLMARQQWRLRRAILERAEHPASEAK